MERKEERREEGDSERVEVKEGEGGSEGRRRVCWIER